MQKLRSNPFTFVDIDLNFDVSPLTKDVAILTDERAIQSSIRRLIFTKSFERKFQPKIYSAIPGLLFEPVSPITAVILTKSIREVIENFEPRVKVSEVETRTNAQGDGYDVRISYEIVSTNRPDEIRLNLRKLR